MAIRIEDVKAAGIAVDIDRLAADGFASISEADRYRLKTQGVCAQRQVGVFMIRIRVPGGKATPDQLTTCPVSGDKLNEMGAPFVFTYKGQEVKLCCKSCKPKFDKDPEKYIAIIRAADKK